MPYVSLSFWKSSHLNLKTSLKDQTSGRLLLLPGCVSVLLGTPTAVFGTSMNLFIPRYYECLYPVCLTFGAGCSGEVSQPVYVNQQTWSEKAHCWGGGPALGLGGRRTSCCLSPSPAPALWPQASHVLYLSLGFFICERSGTS